MNNTEMANLVRLAMDSYVDIVDKIKDPRTTDWPLMQSPVPTVLMVIAYLYVVIILGPRIMRDRKPFKLREVLIAYNGFQVFFSLFMLYEMATLCWWYYISKLTEFADTVFFVMRKKDSQVSLLHLYHHSLTPIETWILVKFLAGGHGTFSNLINNIVHVIMYLYYMMSAMGPEYQKYLWWKKYLTTIQLVQFMLVFVHSAQLLWFDCGYPRFIGPLLLLHSMVFFALFANFYYEAYHTQAKKKRKTIKSE